jgi:hypothetical protein
MNYNYKTDKPDPLARRVNQLNDMNQELSRQLQKARDDNQALRDHKGVPASQPKDRGKLDGKSAVDTTKAAGGTVGAGVIIMAVYAIFKEANWPVGSEDFWRDEGIYAILFGVVNTAIVAVYKAMRKFP